MARRGFTRHVAAAIASAAEKKRQITIVNLIANFRRDNGRTPTEAEIAGLLATSVRRVRHHLSKLQPGKQLP